MDGTDLPLNAGGTEILTVDAARRMARECRYDDWYDKIYALKLFMAGDQRAQNMLTSGDVIGADVMDLASSNVFYTSNDDHPDYPDVELGLGAAGTQNHALVSSRINIQNVVYTDPEFVVDAPHPVIRQAIQSWLLNRWRKGRWGEIFYMVGVDVEAAGVGFCEVGLGQSGMVTVAYRDVLDVMWDKYHKVPGEWDHYFVRDRLSVREAMRRYGHIYSAEEIEGMAQTALMSNRRKLGSSKDDERKVVYEWRFWTPENHCVFLGGITSGEVLNLVPSTDGTTMEYVKAENGLVGGNPYGVIPIVPWTDSWSPGVLRPVGKAETTWRLASMLNAVEKKLRNTSAKAPEITVVNTLGLKPEVAKRIEEANSIDAIGDFLATEVDDVSKVVYRIPAGSVSATDLQLRSILKDELAAATGVSDVQRGQMKQGERTAYEMRQFHTSQGVQAQHTRRTYASFLADIAMRARNIGADFEAVAEILPLEGGELDTSVMPINIFLRHQGHIHVVESSLTSKSQEDRQYERLVRMQQVDMPLVQLGILDPYKVAEDVYADLGEVEPRRMFKEADAPGGTMPSQGVAQTPTEMGIPQQ